MGFTGGSGHIFKTTNAGVSWSDITGNLPDAPADSVIVDPIDKTTLYVGTDIGVFESSNGGATWMEYGSLPDVPVTKLRSYTLNGRRELRASTYGRGMWTIPLASSLPDYTLSVSNSPVTIFPNQTNTFNGTATALRGYNSSVALSCTPGATPPPSTCSASSGVTPTANGAAFQVTFANPNPGSFNFNIHAVGTDPQNTIHDLPVSLQVVDFGLTSTAITGTVTAGGTASYTITATAQGGSFNNPVSLSCVASTLPQLTSCSFSSTSLTPGASSMNSTLTIGTKAMSTAVLSSPTAGSSYYGLWLPLVMTFVAAACLATSPRRNFSKRQIAPVMGAYALMLVLLLPGCGGGGSSSNLSSTQVTPGTPSGTYAITVSGTSGSLTNTTTVTLVVQ